LIFTKNILCSTHYRLWQALLLALAAAGACGDKDAAAAAPLLEPQHRESRDSYVDAFQQNSYKPQKQQIDYSHSYPVYSAPVPEYGPSKESHEPAKAESGYHGVPHFHHHYTVSDAPQHSEHHEEPEKGHGGFELSTVIQFLAKIIFVKLLIKKLILITTLLILPKIKLLAWLLKKKKKVIAANKPNKKPIKPAHSSEEHHDDDDDISLNFFRNTRGLDHLEKRVVGAIEKQETIST